jgi:small subunit ribosomal protein S8
MSMNDPLGDMLTRIRNAQMRGKSTVVTPASQLRASVLDVLLSEGYIRGYEKARPRTVRANSPSPSSTMRASPSSANFKRVSKPGRRVYMGVKDIPSVRNGLGVAIVSTPKGVLSDAECTGCQCWRRSALHRVLRRVPCLVSARNPSR